MLDGYCWLSSCLYIHLPASSQIFQIIDFGIGITTVLKYFFKVKEPAKESPVLRRFFHENHQFVEVFERTKTEDSSILNFFSKN
jgi:hypothetical protein